MGNFLDDNGLNDRGLVEPGTARGADHIFGFLILKEMGFVIDMNKNIFSTMSSEIVNIDGMRQRGNQKVPL